MSLDCPSVGGPCRTTNAGGVRRNRWPWCLERGQGWRNLSVLLLSLIIGSGCGGGSQPGGPSPSGPGSGGPGPLSQAAIVFESFRALDGSDAANTNGAENIWVVSADGTFATPVTRLTAQGIVSRDPVWSPDGSKIAFDSSRAPDGSNATNSCRGFTSNIWAVNSDGSRAIGLTNFVDGSCHELAVNPAWSPNGLKLAATHICCLDLFSNVAVLNADGSNFAVLTSFGGSPQTGTGGGDWSPDGSKLLFDAPVNGLGFSNGPQNVWTMNADGSGQTALTNLTATSARCSQESWSPDGSKVVFTSTRALDGSDAANANSTWVMNADGSSAKPLTKFTANGANNTAPTWSPDGSKLAFESAGALDGSDAANANLTVNIWVVNADGTGATPLTKLTGSLASSHVPKWSPGGSKLTFASMRAIDGRDLSNAASNIWEMNADGSGATPLTKNTTQGADSTNPRWHP
jgi:Tol biopolymer transport system component